MRTLRIGDNPDLLHRVEYMPVLIDARQKVADHIGAKLGDVNAHRGIRHKSHPPKI